MIDKVDKEPPFDLHAYLAPPPVATTAATNADSSGIMTTTTASSTTTVITTNTVTPATPTSVEKPKKEPSKPKLYGCNLCVCMCICVCMCVCVSVCVSVCVCVVKIFLSLDRTSYTIQPSTEAERNLFRLQVQYND